MVQSKRKVNEHQAVLIFFNRVGWRRHLPTDDEVEQAIDMRPSVRARDGLIFGIH